MKASVKLMAEFGAGPVWNTTPGREGPMDTDLLPVSDELKKDLKQWSRQYDAIFEPDPREPGFTNSESETQFHKMGLQLQARLKAELDGRADVED